VQKKIPVARPAAGIDGIACTTLPIVGFMDVEWRVCLVGAGFAVIAAGALRRHSNPNGDFSAGCVTFGR
jgi:hypothetical protein